MTEKATFQRQGRIDEVDLTKLDLASFSDSASPATPALIAGGFVMSAQRYRSTIEKWGFAGRGDIADVASGSGRWSMFLAEVNPSVVGYDRSEAAVALSRKLAAFFDLANVRFEIADIVNLPTAEAAFDGVWMQNTLQHVDRASAFQEARRILRPGGLLFVGLYKGLGKVFESFFRGYAQRGIASVPAQTAILSLKQGPLFDGRGSYASKEHLGAILDQFGFRLSPDHPVEVIMSPQGPAKHPFAEELRDLPALGNRLETDPAFAAEFARHPDVAHAFPLAVEFCAVKT